MNEKRLINLNYLNILEIVGEGAIDLLQGQLTCDLEKVNAENPVLGALCNIKGRLISSFVIINPNLENPNKFWLIGPESMMIKTLTVLKKYSPFYKVEMSIMENKEFYGAKVEALKGFFPGYNIGDNQSDHKGNLILGYLDKNYKLIITNKNNIALKGAEDVTSNLEDWFLDNFYNKDIEITEDLSEKLTPHEINYDLTGRVDFEKGCYTGQEIVARMHYRAKNLPRLYLAEGSNGLTEDNMSIEDQSGKRIGSVIKALKHPNGNYALISIKTDKVEKSYKISGSETLLTVSK